MSLPQPQKRRIKASCAALPGLALLYFFGSRARGDDGPLSDYDFAAFFNPRSRASLPRQQLKLMGDLMRILKSDKVDMVVLNKTTNSILKSNVIRDGQLVFERSGFRDSFETASLHEYFDFRIMESRCFKQP